MDSRGRFGKLVSRLVRGGLALTGLPCATRAFNCRRPLIVMYHGVVPDARPYHNWGQLPESQFRRQLEHLARRYRVVPLREIVTAIRDGRPLPPHAAAITFDDGFANNVHVAWPHLRELGLPATIFLVTGMIGTDRLLWPDEVFLLLWHAARRNIEFGTLSVPWIEPIRVRRCGRLYRRIVTALKRIPAEDKDQALRALRASIGNPVESSPWAADFRLMSWDDARRLRDTGQIELGAHTERHDILTQIPPEEACREISASIDAIRRRLRTDEVPFAYPNGEPTDFSADIIDMVRDAGATCALTTIEGRNPPAADLFTLRRVPVGSDLEQREFEMRCTGFTSALRGIVRRGRKDDALRSPLSTMRLRQAQTNAKASEHASIAVALANTAEWRNDDRPAAR